MAISVSPVRALVGARLPAGTVDPIGALQSARTSLEHLSTPDRSEWSDINALKQRYAKDSRAYYTLAAVSRRRILDPSLRAEILKLLFPLRSTLEQRIIADLLTHRHTSEVLKAATSISFFGTSAKQGVSVRYPLSTCLPTISCGGRCYAHDGRDRELQLIFRAVFNFVLGYTYEESDLGQRNSILNRLQPAITQAVRNAQREQALAADEGFARKPRIRFSHIGEMVSTPAFTNALARAIKDIDSEVECVLYTRHPKANLVDPNLITVNFTIESSSDARIKFVPPTARLVSSAWDGRVMPEAAVNFLEHHVEKHSKPNPSGNVCPVTSSSGSIASCDAARCDLCFQRPQP